MPSQPSSVEDLFARFLALAEEPSENDFESFVRDHPEHAEELRELHRTWRGGLEGLRQARAPGHSSAPVPAAADDPASRIHPGYRLGSFQLERKLGQGGMGQVWEALDHTIGRRVALKLIRPDRTTARAVLLFAREARAGGRLNHPNLVGVLSAGEVDGVHYIAQELVAGQRTLRDKLQEARELAELPASYYRAIGELFAKVAGALEVAHAASVIHRDLKPQNILLTQADEPKVGDFGLARLVDELSLSLTGDLVGTYYYMSPEQVAARRAGIDHRTDIFSLGAVLYEALSFQRPFEGDTSQQVVHQIVFEDPPDPRKLRSRVPEDLAVICAKALEKNPRNRYASMAAFAADLRRYLNDEAIEARPPGLARRVHKWASRHPSASMVIGVSTLALVAISALFARNLRISEALAKSRDQAQASEGLALQTVREVFDLAAASDVHTLADEAQRLWPANPSNVPAYRAWLARAGQVVDGLDKHRQRLSELGARALEPQRSPPEQGRALAEIERLEEVAAATEVRFENREDRWWYSQLEQLIAGIERLADPKTGLMWGSSRESGRGIGPRLEFAETIAERSLTGEEAAFLWDEAIASIADPAECPIYEGMRIEPQMGLLPIGRDPSSRLWEFAHLESGAAPGRDPRTGRLEWDATCGVVFVLLPGGEFWMGAQLTDPSARNYDPIARVIEGPVSAVELAPFFLSKFELTQGQWRRLCGWNPAQYATSDAHPVESVDWHQSVELARQLGADLPTEAQWEYACRAGTSSPYCFGDFSDRLAAYGNVKDRQYSLAASSTDTGEVFDDGFSTHAPVGRYLANAFGLHDMHGNVQEWCADLYGPYTLPTDSRTGARLAPPQHDSGPNLRGGSYTWKAFAARSAARLYLTPNFSGANAGLRLCRRIDVAADARAQR